MFFLQRYIVRLWKRHSVALLRRPSALMIAITSGVARSVLMGVCPDTTSRVETSPWFVRLTDCGREPFLTVNVSAVLYLRCIRPRPNG